MLAFQVQMDKTVNPALVGDLEGSVHSDSPEQSALLDPRDQPDQ